MSRLYLDACCIIYLIEAANPFHSAMVSRLVHHGVDPASRLITSRLSLLECRVRPVRDNDTALLAAYDAFFNADRLIAAGLSAEVVERATRLRAIHGFSSPDALHLGTAIEMRADTFLTGDGILARCTDVAVEVLRPAQGVDEPAAHE